MKHFTRCGVLPWRQKLVLPTSDPPSMPWNDVLIYANQPSVYLSVPPMNPVAKTRHGTWNSLFFLFFSSFHPWTQSWNPPWYMETLCQFSFCFDSTHEPSREDPPWYMESDIFSSYTILGLVVFRCKAHISRQDGLVWGKPVTSVITQPTLKPVSNTHGLTRTTKLSRPIRRKTIKFNFIFYFFCMQVFKATMSAKHIFVVLWVIPFNLTKFLVQ